MMRNRHIFMSVVMFCLLISAAPDYLFAQLNHYEEQLIKEKILNDFHILIDTWKEELYFEMYLLGNGRSKSILSQGEFAQRMVDLQWKPTLSPLRNETVQIIYRNFAAIHFDQQFENKVNQTDTIWKRMVFSTILENKTWKFDLKQLINIPYEGRIVDPVEEEKKAEQTKSAAEKAAQQAPGQAQGQAPGQLPGQVPGQAPGQVPGQAPGQVPGQVPGQAPGQVPGQAPGQAPGQVPGQVPAPGP